MSAYNWKVLNRKLMNFFLEIGLRAFHLASTKRKTSIIRIEWYAVEKCSGKLFLMECVVFRVATVDAVISPKSINDCQLLQKAFLWLQIWGEKAFVLVHDMVLAVVHLISSIFSHCSRCAVSLPLCIFVCVISCWNDIFELIFTLILQWQWVKRSIYSI